MCCKYLNCLHDINGCLVSTTPLYLPQSCGDSNAICPVTSWSSPSIYSYGKQATTCNTYTVILLAAIWILLHNTRHVGWRLSGQTHFSVRIWQDWELKMKTMFYWQLTEWYGHSSISRCHVAIDDIIQQVYYHAKRLIIVNLRPPCWPNWHDRNSNITFQVIIFMVWHSYKSKWGAWSPNSAAPR